ncbi:choice-of-anchor C family protein [Candidatus Halobeggiatoa sp. HSG11]|nr:choice-of-anchor C family protein [Candidatus Halobeggiatoa sp. HSG11]
MNALLVGISQQWRYWMVILVMFGITFPAIADEINLIKNGSFEEGINIDGHIRLYDDSKDITSWRITKGNVDYIGSFWQASDGQRSVEVPGGGREGAISQSFSTEIGIEYKVLFDLAGYPSGNRIPSLTVSVGSYSQDFYFDVAGHNTAQMGWTEKSFTFTANREKTKLTFTGGDIYPAIDNVRVFPYEIQREVLTEPDLTIPYLSIQNIFTDTQTLQVSGIVDVMVENLGIPAESSQITVFEDSNQNGQFDANIDNKLGVADSLAQEIPISGTLEFLDSPIFAKVDSEQYITEADEDNNILSTANMCEIASEEVTFEPELKWEKKSGRVLMTPVVANLEDTNNDGKINQFDIPSIIYNESGKIRAVNGKDGHNIWIANYSTNKYANLAVADIDNDGFVEIIAPYGNRLIALEHTGEFKWQSSVNTYTDNGGVSIADLDGDGNPEIVSGNTVLNADGSLRWQGNGFTGNNSQGSFSVVIDVNRDGKQEIIAGASAYSNTGQKLWQNNTAGDGFTGVGNFNDDDYPEIVIVSHGKVSLLDYNGNFIWGPISIPYGGKGGAPTIADMNGNGIPEIGVAGKYRYVVFDAKGNILWAVPNQDSSSHVTGSSVFDFEGDGQAEVVYADEQYLRIYRGRDGQVLFEIPNRSKTSYEYPVIADVDNDNQADIIIGGDNGIKVYQDKNNSWVNTRKIWNQYNYHITNINDDGTVPRVEAPSWLLHNTYRLNTLNSEKGIPPTAVADLTASKLQIIDNSLTVRIGNGGLVSSPENIKVRFYASSPDKAERLLGNVVIGSIEGGAYQDITLENIGELDEWTTVYAFVDADQQVRECNESNNTAWNGPSPDIAIPASCRFYAINDKNLNNSIFLVFNVDSRLENFISSPLGPLYRGYDIEGLAVDPTSKLVYVSSGDDVGAGKLPGQLYVMSTNNGALIPVGSTGFDEVDSLTFAADGNLWGWAKGDGLIHIDTKTGKAALMLPSDKKIEDLALAKTGNVLLYGAENTKLLKYQVATNELETQCENLPKETEALEALTENLLLLGTHKGELLQVFNIEQCQVENSIRIPTGEYRDVEGIGVIAEECPLGEMVEKAIELPVDEQICLSLEQFEVNDSVEGFDVLYPGLSLMTSGSSKVIVEGKSPAVYDLSKSKANGCIGRGIGDKNRYHDYTFLLSSGLTFKNFSLQTFDFGDYNPNNASQHSISLVGYNDQEKLVIKDTLSYTNSNFSGTGEACKDELGQIGKYPFEITSSGITKVKLEYYNNKTGKKPSDDRFAIGNICFTLERLPSKLLKYLPRDYVSEHVGEFIDDLQYDRISKFPRDYIIRNLIRLQNKFIREYVNGLPGDIIQDFFAGELQEPIASNYPERLIEDILEEFPQDFQDKFRQEFPQIENTVETHVKATKSDLTYRYKSSKKWYVGIEVPTETLRYILSDEAGDMFTGILTDLLESSSDESIIDVLDKFPDYILNKLLDNHEN